VQTEYVVACEILDEEYPPLPISYPYDDNIYTFGRISHHNVVIACLPKGKYGLTSAASVAKDMLRSFPSIRFGMMVGIGGGAPSLKHDIRLGDVVVSSPVGRTGGVIYYEFGKTIQNRQFERMGTLDAPPPMLLMALSLIGAQHERKGHRIAESVSKMIERNPRLRRKYQRPEPRTDRLYRSSFIHPDPENTCEEICGVEAVHLIPRNERTADEDDPAIHYGLIASADRLMKDAQARDTLARNEGVLCFEMEAAGLMDHFPCVVIRGICDYSDTHKNNTWQGYAAATAAAYAKELLDVIPPAELPSIHDTVLRVNSLANPVSAEESSAMGPLVQNTTSSSFITERPGETPTNKEEIRNTQAHASDDGDYTIVHTLIKTSVCCTLEGHSSSIGAVAFSSDGRLVASGTGDRTVKLWDAATGAVRRMLEGHSDPIGAVAFSPDGRLVASGSWDRTVKLWDAATGAVRRMLEGHSDLIGAVAFSPDGRLVASGSWDRMVKLWDAATGAVRHTLEGHSGPVLAVAFSPDGRLVASGSWDRTVKLWDAATGAVRCTLEGHSDLIGAVAFSPDGRLVASGSWDRKVRLWDAVVGAVRCTLEGHSGPVLAVAFSPDGRLVASGSWDRTVKLWDAATGAVRRTLEGHSDPILAVAFSPDGRLVASGSEDKMVKLWHSILDRV
jgi:WD40 repeat protein/nucleoside phosphorylase